MPALDRCHEQVVRSIEKEGWRIRNAPAVFTNVERTVYIDVEAVRNNNGVQQSVLLMEIKCFPQEQRTSHDLYTGIGQYLIYRAMLAEKRRYDLLYLAVPQESYEKVFDRVVMRVIEQSHIHMVIVNLEREEVVQWLHH